MSNNYSHLGLNAQLQADSGPAAHPLETTDSFGMSTNYQRSSVSGFHIKDASISNAKIGTAAIGTANIGTLSFNEISGGTAILGGTNNVNGVLRVINANGTTSTFVADSGTVTMVLPTGGTIFVVDTNTETLTMGGIQLGGTAIGPLGEGGIIFMSGTSQFANLSVDEFFIDKPLRMGNLGTSSTIFTRPIQLSGTSTSNPVGTPAGNAVKIYCDLSGGKNRIMAQFSSGTPVQVAIQP